MIALNPAIRSDGATFFSQLGRAVMDVILHVGAHRTATTSFQHHLRAQRADLSRQNVGFWGPIHTRTSVFPGLFRTAGLQRRRHVGRRAEGRLALMLARLEAQGVEKLIVSDENMIGTCVQNFRYGALYPAIGDRMARVAAAFDGRISRVLLTVRAQDLWWASAAAFTVARGHKVPTAAKCRQISDNRRCWRDVIVDLSCAVPDAQILVMPFERANGRANLLLSEMLDREIAPQRGMPWLNRSANLRQLRNISVERGSDPHQFPEGEGRWNPFSPAQSAALREAYADDLHWLTAGADGLAKLTQDTPRPRAGTSLPPGQNTEGHTHDQGHPIAQGHLAQHR